MPRKEICGTVYKLFSFPLQGDVGELFGFNKYKTQRILADMISDIMLDSLSEGIGVSKLPN